VIGRTFGQYRILDEIGSGGMGAVYRAHDDRLDRDVAIKVLLPGTLQDEAARKRFRREALTLSRLNHPNIATIHDFNSEGDVDFVVMELLEGSTLSDLLRTRLPIERVVRIALQIVSALEEAHDRGIVHRDLKPGNIMVTPRGQVKLLDFGLAVPIKTSEPEELTKSLQMATVAGTMPYMSPEQLRGEAVDARSDIWAAGAVMYEMATGRRPFPETQGPTLIGAILHQSPQPLRELNPHTPLGFQHLVLKSLHKAPEERYQSARELHAALDQLHASGPISDTAPVVPTVDPRRGAVRYAGVAIALLLMTLGAWRFWPSPAPAESRVLVLVGEFANRTGEPVFDHTLQDLLKTALQESRLINVFPQSRANDVLARMERPPSTPVTDEVGREIVQREGLQALVSGSIARLGSNYLLIVQASGPEGASLASEQGTAADAGQVPAALDAIARRIRAALGESLASVQSNSPPLARVTSTSLDAVRYVTLGKQRLDASDPDEALSWFQKAVALDNSFAMAHALQGIAYQNLNRLDLAESSLKTASDLADRVTATERLKIIGDYRVLIGDYDEGCNAFAALGRLQPQDPSPFHGLGICYARQGNYDAAIAETEKARALLSSLPARNNIARMLLHKGDLARARAESEAILKDAPTHTGARRMLARVFELEGNVSQAQRLLQAMVDTGGGFEIVGRSALGDLLVATGRAEEARQHFDGAMVAAEKRGDQLAATRARVALAEYLLERGFGPQAVAALGDTRLAATDPALLVRVGRFHARARRTSQTADTLRTLQEIAAKKPFPHLRSLQGLLEAEIALANRQPKIAVEAAERAQQFEPTVVVHDALARAYDAADRPIDAIRWFQDVLAHAGARADGDDEASFKRVVEIQYRLGVLLDGSGRSAEARQYLETFLSYWAAADPNLPMKKDAAERLRRLPAGDGHR
jgi:eukaryotic-like serine/threonine-protein kinase